MMSNVDNLANAFGGRITEVEMAFFRRIAPHIRHPDIIGSSAYAAADTFMSSLEEKETDVASVAPIDAVSSALFSITYHADPLVDFKSFMLPATAQQYISNHPNLRFVDRMGLCHYFTVQLKHEPVKGALTNMLRRLVTALVEREIKSYFHHINAAIPSTEFQRVRTQRLIDELYVQNHPARSVFRLQLDLDVFWIGFLNGTILRMHRPGRRENPDEQNLQLVDVKIGTKFMVRCEFVPVLPDIPADVFLYRNPSVYHELAHLVEHLLQSKFGVQIPCIILPVPRDPVTP